jgi:uncharacterized protein YggE
MLRSRQTIFCLAMGIAATGLASAQTSQVQLKIEPSNRTLTVSAEERVTADPEIAILHIGFETQPSDAKTAYAEGAKISNEIIAALKQSGIADSAIRSENQRLNSFDYKLRKFKLVQHWTVKTPPERAAEILDIVIAAGATQSGDIDWTVKDAKALEDQALEQAAARARANAEVLAHGMGVHLGALVYVSNDANAARVPITMGVANYSGGTGDWSALPRERLAIEPRKVSRVANVYAVFAIE